MSTEKGKKEVFEISQEEIGSCGKKFSFLINQKNLNQQAKIILGRFVNQVNIPGFRRGKAPESIVRKKYEKELIDELRSHLFSLALREIESDANLDIVSWSNPEEKSELQLDRDFEFSFIFECAPEVQLPDYKNIKIELPEAEITEEMIQKQIDHFGEMYGSYEDVDDVAGVNDMLKVSYTSDFEPDENATPFLCRQVKAEENWIWLTEPETIPGVIAALTGAEKDKDYEFTAEYPEDYREEALRGRKVTYKVHVKAVQRRKFLNEAELCEKMKFDSAEKLREIVKENLKRENEMKKHDEILGRIREELMALTPEFPLSEQILNGEIQNEVQRMAREIIKSENDAEVFKEKLEEHKAEATGKAKERLRMLFICRAIAAKEGISVSDQDVRDQVKAMSSYYNYKAKDMLSTLERNGGLEEIKLDMMTSKVLNFIKEKSETNK